MLASGLPDQDDDKFNKVMGSTKEDGGLLASIGLKKEDMKVNDDDSIADDDQDESLGDLHKNSDLFDPSKDKEGGDLKKRTALDDDDDDDFEDDFDLDLDDPLKKAKNKRDADLEEKS